VTVTSTSLELSGEEIKVIDTTGDTDTEYDLLDILASSRRRLDASRRNPKRKRTMTVPPTKS